jgi:hypothetical protein
MAAIFGDKSIVNDAFIAAWRVPNLFRRLLGEGALSTSLQTKLTEVDHDHGEAAGRALFPAHGPRDHLDPDGPVPPVHGRGALGPDTVPYFGWRWLGQHPEPFGT